jgi:hypothetical protein
MAEVIYNCPFCGSVEVEIARTNPGACWVSCANYKCDAETSSRKTRRGAIAVWNKRVSTIDVREATVVYDMDKESEERRANAP